MTKIEIPAELWTDWPKEPGWYFYGSTLYTDVAELIYVSSRLYPDWFDYDDGCEMKRKRSDDYRLRYARVELPVPQARTADQCPKS